MKRGHAYWTFDPEGPAWYLGLNERAEPPYKRQVHVRAILDLDDQGRLAGVEIIDMGGNEIPEPPDLPPKDTP